MLKNRMQPLNTVINRLLSLDPDSAKRLQKISGQVVAIELLPFHFIFYCHVQDAGLTLTTEEISPVATRISGTPLMMLGLFCATENRQSFFMNDITMEGDVELGQDVMALFDALDIDWTEHFSRLVGDVPAYHVSRLLKNFSTVLSDINEKLSNDVDDFIHEEKKWLPTTEALADFFAEVDTLRFDVDRIEAKIKHFLAEKGMTSESI